MCQKKEPSEYMRKMQEQASRWLRASEYVVEKAIADKDFAAAKHGYYALEHSVDAYKYLGLIADPISMERKLKKFQKRIYGE